MSINKEWIIKNYFWGIILIFSVFAPLISFAQTVYFNPQNINIDANTQFSLPLKISDVNNLFGVAFDLNFDSNLLNYINTQEGSFLNQGCNTSLMTNSETAGKLIFGLTRLGSACGGVNGSGLIATINFSSKNQKGINTLNFSNNSLCIFNGSACNYIVGTWNQPTVTIGSPNPDTIPPSVPANLSAAAISSSQINLSWTVSTDNVGVAGYKIYRCSGSNCTPSVQIATAASNSYLNSGLAASTAYRYTVTAYDAAGNVSTQSSVVSAATTQVAPDTISPTVSITAPFNNATVANSIVVSANASDNVGVIGVQFKLDGVNLGAEDITAPYSIDWNTNLTANGSHILTAAARDAANNQNLSAPITVAVSNATATPIPSTPPPTSGGGGTTPITDTTPPSMPSSFQAQMSDKQIVLNWQNPKDSDFSAVVIVRKENSQPASINDGTKIYQGTAQTYTDMNLDNTKIYYYAIYAYDQKLNYSSPAVLSGKPAQSEAGKISIGLSALPTVSLPQPSQTSLPSPSAPSLVSVSPSNLFVSGPFAVGMSSNQVKILQQMLSQDKTIYPEGKITGFYGTLTVEAVQRFQCKYGIVCSGAPDTTGYGLAGPATRTKINAVLGKLETKTQVQTTTNVQTATTLTITKSLYLGLKDQQVTVLQTILAKDKTIYPEGLITGYFGPLTQKAVQKFQCKYDIICLGTPDTTGYGFVGPKTRAQIKNFIETINQ